MTGGPPWAGTAPTRLLRCRTTGEGRLRQVNRIRDLPPQVVDEPAGLADAGAPSAPQALELLLAALGSCLALGIRANAAARGVLLTGLELEVEAEVEAAPMDAPGPGPRPLGLQAVRVCARLEGDAPRDALAALVTRAVLWSPVANTLHDGVLIDAALAPPPRR